MADASFKLRHRVLTRFSETDMQGVIFNGRYLDYADLGISIYWTRAGMVLFGDGKLEFLVANANIDFKASMRAFEHVELCCRTERIGATSLTTLIEIHGENGPDDLRAAIRIVHVCIDPRSHRPVPLPDSVRALLSGFDARPEVLLTGERA